MFPWLITRFGGLWGGQQHTKRDHRELTIPSDTSSSATKSTNITGSPQNVPFRLLDLPRELRDLIYEQCFTGFHGLTPHPITQTNTQIRKETLKMFYKQTHTYEVSLFSAKQVAGFLKAVEAGQLTRDVDVEFSYKDPDAGITIIRIEWKDAIPAQIFESTKQKFLEFCSSSPLDSYRTIAWALCLGFGAIIYETEEPLFTQYINGPHADPDDPRIDIMLEDFPEHKQWRLSVFLFWELAKTSWGRHRGLREYEKIANFLFNRTLEADAKATSEAEAKAASEAEAKAASEAAVTREVLRLWSELPCAQEWARCDVRTV
ncbi:hypothetical protein Q7P37_000371 [Cladosporium fusiforme]